MKDIISENILPSGYALFVSCIFTYFESSHDIIIASRESYLELCINNRQILSNFELWRSKREI